MWPWMRIFPHPPLQLPISCLSFCVFYKWPIIFHAVLDCGEHFSFWESGSCSGACLVSSESAVLICIFLQGRSWSGALHDTHSFRALWQIGQLGKAGHRNLILGWLLENSFLSFFTWDQGSSQCLSAASWYFCVLSDCLFPSAGSLDLLCPISLSTSLFPLT